MYLKSFSGLLVAAALSIAPSYAQGYDVSTSGNHNVNPAPALPNIGRAYGISVITGAHSSAGWEKPLTEGDPNLKHWTWVPVTSYDHGYLHSAPGGSANYKRPDHVYAKPNHVPLPIVDHGPVQQPPNRAWWTNNTGTRTATADLSGKVRLPKRQVDHSLIAETKVYSSGYGDVSGHIRPSNVTAYSENTAVYGKLMTHAKTH